MSLFAMRLELDYIKALYAFLYKYQYWQAEQGSRGPRFFNLKRSMRFAFYRL